MEAFGVDEGFLLLQQGGLSGGLQLRQGLCELLLLAVEGFAVRLGAVQCFLGGKVLFVECLDVFAQFGHLCLLVVVVLFGFIGQCQLALALLPFEGLLLELLLLLLEVLLLLLVLAHGHFDDAVLAVGFQKGELGLLEAVLAVLVLCG